MPSFAFYDLDHTLLPHDTQTLFANYVLRREGWRRIFWLFFAPFALLRALNLIRTVTAKRAFISYLTGMRREKLESYAQDFAQTTVRPTIYPELLKSIAENRAAGRVLILNTASPAFYAKEIAQNLGFDHCIATPVEIPETVPLMPKVHGGNNKHEAKIVRMMETVPAVAAATPDELLSSWAYSDSPADLPLLELAGNAVLVHPSLLLAAIGKERGWPILHPTRPYSGKIGDLICSVRQAFGLFPIPPTP